MKKYFFVLIAILSSCSIDQDIIETIEQDQTSIFDNSEMLVSDEQPIEFEVDSSQTMTLVLLNEFDNVLTKEKFIAVEGKNIKTLYIKAIPSGRYEIVLYKGSEEFKSTFIQIQ